MPKDTRAPLDIDRVQELANLPLTDDERDELAQACQAVLDAFALPDVDPDELAPGEPRLFEDAPEPWPENDVAAILNQVPIREGREIQG